MAHEACTFSSYSVLRFHKSMCWSNQHHYSLEFHKDIPLMAERLSQEYLIKKDWGCEINKLFHIYRFYVWLLIVMQQKQHKQLTTLDVYNLHVLVSPLSIIRVIVLPHRWYALFWANFFARVFNDHFTSGFQFFAFLFIRVQIIRNLV